MKLSQHFNYAVWQARKAMTTGHPEMAAWAAKQALRFARDIEKNGDRDVPDALADCVRFAPAADWKAPSVGDPIEFAKGYNWYPVGVVTEVIGDVCYYKPYGNDDVTCFIWKFHDGLNRIHRWPGRFGGVAMEPVDQYDGLPMLRGSLARRRLFSMYGIPNSAPEEHEFEAVGSMALFSTKRLAFVDDFNDGEPKATWMPDAEEWL